VDATGVRGVQGSSATFFALGLLANLCLCLLPGVLCYAEGALEQDNGAASDLSAPRPLIVKCADPQRCVNQDTTSAAAAQ
jgi:hypothetical protein